MLVIIKQIEFWKNSNFFSHDGCRYSGVQSRPAKLLDKLSFARWLLTRIFLVTIFPASNLMGGDGSKITTLWSEKLDGARTIGLSYRLSMLVNILSKNSQFVEWVASQPVLVDSSSAGCHSIY